MTTSISSHVLIVIYLVLLFIKDVETSRFLTKYSSPQMVVVGSNFTFQWKYELSASDKPKFLGLFWGLTPFMWFQSLAYVSPSGAKIFAKIPPYRNRIKWTGDLSKSVATFVLLNITQIDERDYGVMLSFSSQSLEKTDSVKLEVLVPPVITKPPKDITAKEGETLQLTCEASGKPTPTITWTNNGKQLSIGQNFNINKIERSDAGEYVCMADNKARKAKTSTAKVTVLYEVEVNRSASSKNASSWIGQTVNLNCATDGVPVPTIRWIKPDGTQLKQESTRISKASMTIKEKTDFGQYQCIANNGFPSAGVLVINIKEICNPGSPTIQISEEDITASSVTVRWEAPCNDGGSPVIDYRVRLLSQISMVVKEHIVSGGARKLHIVGLTTNTSYTLEVCALNIVGEGQPGTTVVTTKVIRTNPTKNPTPAPITTSTDIYKPDGTWICSKVVHIGYGIVITLLVLVIVALSIRIKKLKSERGNQRNTCSVCRKSIQEETIVMTPVWTNEETSHTVESNQETTTSTEDNVTQYPKPLSEYMPLVPSTRSWEVERNNIKIIKIIGKGAFSRVGKGTAIGIRGTNTEVTVAVKMLKENAPASDRSDLLAEVKLMKTLKRHPHVIKLLGCVTESEPPMIIVEYVPYGDLLGYLRKSRGLNDTYYQNPDATPHSSLTSHQLMQFAWQVADGMTYLSSRKIIHRDLAARNVLVGEGTKCKVTDFGMARDVHQDDIYAKKTGGRLPVKWTAYESLLYGIYTTQSDVWSYGVLLYEIFTLGGRPYPNMDGRCIVNRLQEGYRMPKPSHLNENLYKIMADCWNKTPDERPTFATLRELIAKMEKNHRTYINMKDYDSSLYSNVEELNEM